MSRNKASLISWVLLLAAHSARADGEVIPDFNRALKEACQFSVSCSADVSPPPIRAGSTDSKLWKKGGFGNPKIEYLSALDFYRSEDPSQFTHELRLTTVLFRKTGWSVDQIKARMELLAKVYKQCGIRINSVKVVEANAPKGWLDVDGCHDFKGNRSFKVAGLTPSTEKPVLYYVRSTRDESVACAGPLFNVGESSPMLGTVWMGSGLNDDPTQPWNFPQFSDEAHELGHVLLNAGHVVDGSWNLMAGAGKLLNGQLTPTQCETMRKSDWVKKL